MADAFVGFVDAGVLRSLRKDYFRPQGTVIADWFRGLEKNELRGERFLRLYWYDGRYDPSHPRYPSQRRFFDAIGQTPGIQMRFGHLVERADAPLQQKGVDTLLELDPVRLSGRAVCSTAILIVNDRDFAEAIRKACGLHSTRPTARRRCALTTKSQIQALDHTVRRNRRPCFFWLN